MSPSYPVEVQISSGDESTTDGLSTTTPKFRGKSTGPKKRAKRMSGNYGSTHGHLSMGGYNPGPFGWNYVYGQAFHFLVQVSSQRFKCDSARPRPPLGHVSVTFRQ